MEMLHNPVFWVVASFVLLIGLSYKKVSGMMVTALDARSARIRSEFDQARSLREEAEKVLAEYQRKQAEYLKEAEAMLAKARQDADAFRAASEKELKAAMDARMRQAMEKIEREEAQAVQEVRNHVVDIALAAARSVIADQAGKASQDDLIKLTIADIERKIH
jgi:F-type H+-transporting ATPase subunit b